ncbi:hypothetical protein ACWGSA_10800 [Streptomyces diastaticus]
MANSQVAAVSVEVNEAEPTGATLPQEGEPPSGSLAVHTVWQAAGLFGLVGGFARSSGARLTWTAWGAASIAMVHSAAPADGRTIATGLAVLGWTAASTLALRGLTLGVLTTSVVDSRRI